MRHVYVLLLLMGWLSSSPGAQAQPEHSFFVIHCDPGFAHLWPKLRQMVQYASAHDVPLTLELSPQWVEAILADPARIDTVRAWQAWGHEIGAHHHGIYHCFWDSLANYPIDTIWAIRTDTTWVPAACEPGAYKGTLDAFYDQLDQLAGDSLLLTWGSSDEHPEVDLYPGVPYRTDGSRYDPERAFSNPYVVTHGPWTAGNQTWGPYTTCQIDYFFIDKPGKVNAVKNLYLDTNFSGNYSVAGVVTHVFDFNESPDYFYQWINFISGKGCKTVREILRQADCGQTTATHALSQNATLRAWPNPAIDQIRIEWEDMRELTIRDLTGRIVQQRHGLTGQAIIGVHDWPAGVYIAEARSERHIALARIVVQ